MKLIGFSRYDFEIVGERMIIRNIDTGRNLSPISDRYHAYRKFALVDDNDNKRMCSELRIAFAIKHGCDIHTIPSKIRFYGSVSNPIIGKRPTSPSNEKEGYNRLMELEQSLDILKYAYYTKDYSGLVSFAYANKRTAIAVVSKRIFVSIPRLEEFWDDGLDIFIDSVKDLKFTSLKPLMNYLCTSLKYGYLRNKDKYLPVIDAILSDKPIPRRK